MWVLRFKLIQLVKQALYQLAIFNSIPGILTLENQSRFAKLQAGNERVNESKPMVPLLGP